MWMEKTVLDAQADGARCVYISVIGYTSLGRVVILSRSIAPLSEFGKHQDIQRMNRYAIHTLCLCYHIESFSVHLQTTWQY